ncbi:hypothetical protein ABBQ32_008298 [Trebouxia sp. C0010 RCD-2024]
MSEYEDASPLCWKPARATFVIPPGRSDHEPCRPAGKAYGGPALTTYQRSTAAVHGYWQTAGLDSLHVQGAQLTAGPRKLTEAQQDHIILGTDNYFKSSQTKWDQHIGERGPRTRGVPGYTGVQPRPEQVRGTPDHTQGSVRPSDPDLLKTHCRLVPSYAGLANVTATGMHSTATIPKLNLAAVTAEKGHAGECNPIIHTLDLTFSHARLLVYWLVSAACAQVMERTLMRWLLSQAWRDPLLVPTAFIQAQLTQGRQAVQHLQER